MGFLHSMHSDHPRIMQKSCQDLPQTCLLCYFVYNLVGVVGDHSGGLSCHYALSRNWNKAHGNNMASMLRAQHLAPNSCHDVSSQHRAITDHSLMCLWHHTHRWACRGLAAGIWAVESHSITSVPHLLIQNIPRVTTRWLVSGDAEIGQGRSQLGERRLGCLHRFLCALLHVPQSCAHGISPCGIVLSADRQGSFFFTQALETLPAGAAVPNSSCMHMPPDPMPSSTPWGCERGEQGIVECKLHRVIKAGNSTAPMRA